MTTENGNRIINGLWIGDSLSPVELLCIHSYINHGHIFHLWTYSDVVNIPRHRNVIQKSAEEILKKESVFSYAEGPFPGSYAGFSDIFRYKLLFERGGWWVDMDSVCLRKFDFPEDYVFRTHETWGAVYNLMKFPKGEPALARALERAVTEVNAKNVEWALPVFCLTEELRRADLLHYARNDICNEDDLQIILRLLSENIAIPKEWFALHLCSEWIVKNGINKNAIPKNCTVGKLIALNEVGVLAS